MQNFCSRWFPWNELSITTDSMIQLWYKSLRPAFCWKWTYQSVLRALTTTTGGRGASVSACAGITNQLLSCWVDSRTAWIKKHWHSNLCRRPVDGGGGTARTVLLTSAKKSHLRCRISFELSMGFQTFVVINKFTNSKFYNRVLVWMTL